MVLIIECISKYPLSKYPHLKNGKVVKIPTAEFSGYSKYPQQNFQGIQNTHSRIYRVKYPQYNLQGSFLPN